MKEWAHWFWLKFRLSLTPLFMGYDTASKEGKCSIHEKKPFECRAVFVCENDWTNHRSDIEDEWIVAGTPLGMRPEIERFSIYG